MDIVPKVYVVQYQQKWDGNGFVPKYDLSSAHLFGEIEYLLSPTARPFNPVPIVTELDRKLAQFTIQDFLLLIGNPVLIGMVCAIASNKTNGVLKVLQWSGKDQQYIKIELNL